MVSYCGLNVIDFPVKSQSLTSLTQLIIYGQESVVTRDIRSPNHYGFFTNLSSNFSETTKSTDWGGGGRNLEK